MYRIFSVMFTSIVILTMVSKLYVSGEYSIQVEEIRPFKTFDGQYIQTGNQDFNITQRLRLIAYYITNPSVFDLRLSLESLIIPAIYNNLSNQNKNVVTTSGNTIKNYTKSSHTAFCQTYENITQKVIHPEGIKHIKKAYKNDTSGEETTHDLNLIDKSSHHNHSKSHANTII